MYDTLQGAILDPIGVNMKFKELLNYQVNQVCINSDNIFVHAGGPGISLLITEHNLLCQIRILAESEDDMPDLIENQGF